MIENKINLLVKEFIRIKKLEYVKGINNGNTSVSKTFEKLIGENKELVNYINNNSITIKAKRSYSKAYITLFDMVPDSDGEELIKISRNYGRGNLNVVKGEVSASKYTRINGYYYFILRVDYDNEKVYLEIYDIYKNLLEDNISWSFSELKKRLLKKLSVLVLVKAWPDKIGGVEYLKYYKMYIYFLREFNYFIEAIAEGIVKINIKISYDGKRLLSHKVSFVIKEEDLVNIFDLYR